MSNSPRPENDSNFELVKNPSLLDFFSYPAAILKNESLFFVNKSFTKLYNLSTQTSPKLNLKELLDIDESSTILTLNKLTKNIASKNPQSNLRAKLKITSTEKTFSLLNLKPISADYFLLEITPDVFLKNQEKPFQNYSMLINNLSHCSCLINSDFKLLETNSEFTDNFKTDFGTHNKGNLADIFPEDILKEFESAINTINSDEAKFYDFETEYKHHEKHLIEYYKIEVSRIENTNNFLLIFINQSHEVGLLKKLTEAEEKAKNLKSIFVAQVSHEIRTPINAILSFASLLKEEIKDAISPELQTGFDVITRGGDRIVRTINLILDLSEVMTDSHEFLPGDFDLLTEVLSEVFLKYKKIAQERCIETSLTSRALTHNVFCDQYMVKQIFSNILDNAVKFTTEGEIDVELYSEESGKLCINVSDTGIGISDDYITNIFEPFSQEDEGINRRYEGNGLGLTLSKKYCDINDIEMKISKNDTNGTLVQLKFNTTAFETVRSLGVKTVNL